MKSLRKVMRWLLVVFFIAASIYHFRTPHIYLAMMPAWVPWPATVNTIVGAAEFLGGLGLMFAAIRSLAGGGLIILLLAVFPANVHVALLGKMPGTDFSPLALWLRLPLQLVFIAWVWWTAFESSRSEPPGSWS